MEHGTDFDLKLAIELYIQEIDDSHLLDRDERDELFDHFLSGMEDLIHQGLTEKEAFQQCQERFGETALISREYEKANPFGALRRIVASGLMLFFSMLVISSLLNLLTIISYRGGRYLALTPKWIERADLGLKILLIGGLATYLVYRLKKRPFFKKAELWLIPTLGMIIPSLVNRLIALGYYGSNPYHYQKELFHHMFTNSAILTYGLLLVPVFICYYVLYRAKRPANISPGSKRAVTVFMLFFHLLIISAIISVISPISLNLGHLLHLSVQSISMFDLLLKISMVISLFIYTLYRLKRQVFFGRIELLVLPLLGLLTAFFADNALLFIPVSILVNQELFRQVLQNSGWLYEISFLVLIVISYILVAKEQKRLTTNFL